VYDGLMPTLTAVDAREIRAWMTAHRYTVRGLATALGINYRTVQRYRDGHLPVPRAIELALQALAVNPNLPPPETATSDPLETQDVPTLEVEREPFQD
jgi:hypothetical protein